MKFSPLDPAALIVVLLLSASCLPANAEDICSREGKIKMRAASVTEPQIAKICPAATTAQPTTAAAPLIDMDDLRLDMALLDGRKVRVRGVGNYMMDMFMLKKSMTDMSPIIVDTSKLQREQRRQIIQKCGDIMTGCRVTVIGTVGEVSYQNGIVAENIEW